METETWHAWEKRSVLTCQATVSIDVSLHVRVSSPPTVNRPSFVTLERQQLATEVKYGDTRVSVLSGHSNFHSLPAVWNSKLARIMIKFKCWCSGQDQNLKIGAAVARGWVSILARDPVNVTSIQDMRRYIKVKMATESGKTTQALPLKGVTGKQWRQAKKLSLFLMGKRRMRDRCSSRRICWDKEEHSSRGIWIFGRSALWIEPLRCLRKLAIADQLCSRGFFFDEWECAGS